MNQIEPKTYYTFQIGLALIVLGFGWGLLYPQCVAAESDVKKDSSDFKSQTSPDLDYYIRLALKSNAALKASYNLYQAEVEKAPQARSLPNPKVSYAYFIENVETRVGPQEHKVGVSQSFPWFGTLGLQGKAAEDSAKAAYYEFENGRLNVVYKVSQAYFEYYFLGQSIRIIKENVDLLKNIERVARSRYRTGIGTYADVIRSQVELEKLLDQLKTTEDLQEPLLARFNAVLNRSPNELIPWPTSIPNAIKSLDKDTLLASIVDSNPQLKALDRRIEQAKKQKSLAAKDGLPGFKVGFDYIFTGDSVAPMSDSGKDPMIATATIDLPIWRGKYSAQRREAQSRLLAAQHSKQERLNQLFSELKATIFYYSDALRKIELYRDKLIPKANQSFQATKTSYEAGKSSFIDLIDAERMLLEFQLAYEQSLSRFNQEQAKIEMLVGRQVFHDRPFLTLEKDSNDQTREVNHVE